MAGNNPTVLQWANVEQTGVHGYNGIFFRNKKEQTIDTHHKALGSSALCCSERGQTQKAIYCMIPFIEHSQKDRTLVWESRSVLGWGWGEGLTPRGSMREFQGVMEFWSPPAGQQTVTAQ